MFKRSKHIYIFTFKLSQNYYESPKGTIRANGNTNQLFKPMNFRDVQSLKLNKAGTDMTLDEYKYLIFTRWDQNYRPLTIDMTEDKTTGRYRLCPKNIFAPDSSTF